MDFEQEVEHVRQWFKSPRFQGIKRVHSAREVVEQRGTIRKRWSGLAKEVFTDADDFGVELAGLAPELKVLAFAATVLLDVVHFERAKG